MLTGNRIIFGQLGLYDYSDFITNNYETIYILSSIKLNLINLICFYFNYSIKGNNLKLLTLDIEWGNY